MDSDVSGTKGPISHEGAVKGPSVEDKKEEPQVGHAEARTFTPTKAKDISTAVQNATSELTQVSQRQDEISTQFYDQLHSGPITDFTKLNDDCAYIRGQIEGAKKQLAATKSSTSQFKTSESKEGIQKHNTTQALELRLHDLEQRQKRLESLLNSDVFKSALSDTSKFFEASVNQLSQKADTSSAKGSVDKAKVQCDALVKTAEGIKKNANERISKLEEQITTEKNSDVKKELQQVQREIHTFANAGMVQLLKQAKTTTSPSFLSSRKTKDELRKTREQTQKRMLEQKADLHKPFSTFSTPIGKTDEERKSTSIFLTQIQQPRFSNYLSQSPIGDDLFETASESLRSTMKQYSLDKVSKGVEKLAKQALETEHALQKEISALSSSTTEEHFSKGSELSILRAKVHELESELNKLQGQVAATPGKRQSIEILGKIAQVRSQVDNLKGQINIVNNLSESTYQSYMKNEMEFKQKISSLAKHSQKADVCSELYHESVEFLQECIKLKGSIQEPMSQFFDSKVADLLGPDGIVKHQLTQLTQLTPEEVSLKNSILSGKKQLDRVKDKQIQTTLRSLIEKEMSHQVLVNPDTINPNTLRLLQLCEAKQVLPADQNFQLLLNGYKQHVGYDHKVSMAAYANAIVSEIQDAITAAKSDRQTHAATQLFQANKHIETLKNVGTQEAVELAESIGKELKTTQGQLFPKQLNQLQVLQESTKKLRDIADKAKEKGPQEVDEKVIVTAKDALKTEMIRFLYSDASKSDKDKILKATEELREVLAEVPMHTAREKIYGSLQQELPSLTKEFYEQGVRQDVYLPGKPILGNEKTYTEALRSASEIIKATHASKRPRSRTSETLQAGFSAIRELEWIKATNPDDPALKSFFDTENRRKSLMSVAASLPEPSESKIGKLLKNAQSPKEKIVADSQKTLQATVRTLLTKACYTDDITKAKAERKLENIMTELKKNPQLRDKILDDTTISFIEKLPESTVIKTHFKDVLDLKKHESIRQEFLLRFETIKKLPEHERKDSLEAQKALLLKQLPEGQEVPHLLQVLFDNAEKEIANLAIREQRERALLPARNQLKQELEMIKSSDGKDLAKKLEEAKKRVFDKIPEQYTSNSAAVFALIPDEHVAGDRETNQLISYMVQFAGETRISMTEEKDTILGLFKKLSNDGDPKIRQLREVFNQFELRPRAQIDERDVAKVIFNTMNDLSSRSLLAVTELSELTKHLPIANQSTKEKLTSDLERLQKATQTLKSAIADSTEKKGLLSSLDEGNKEIAKQMKIIEDSNMQIKDPAARKIVQDNANKAMNETRNTMFDMFLRTQDSVIPALAEHGKEYAEALSSVMSHFKEIDGEIARKGEKVTLQEKEAIGKYQQVKSKFNQMLTGSTKVQIAELLNNTPTSKQSLRDMLLETHAAFEKAARSYASNT